MRQAEAPQAGRDMKGQQNIPKLSVKRADGTVIEADAPLLMMPGIGLQILDHAVDRAADGLLAYKLGRDLPPQPEAIEKIKTLLGQTVPGAKITVDNDLRVLVVTGDRPEDLRRAAALMRACYPDGKQGFGPPEQTERFVKKGRGEQPEEVIKNPRIEPGQF
jgi:hypothetical protein